MLTLRWLWTECKMNIFCPYHGEQACDRICETVKCLLYQILVLSMTWKIKVMSPSGVFQFCYESIQNSIFKFISKIDADNIKVILNERFEGKLEFQTQDHFSIFYWDENDQWGLNNGHMLIISSEFLRTIFDA